MGTSITASSSLSGSLRDLYAEESARIHRDFEATGDGRAAVARRTRLIEDIAHRLWQELISSELQKPAGFALVADLAAGFALDFFGAIDLTPEIVQLRQSERTSETHSTPCGYGTSQLRYDPITTLRVQLRLNLEAV